MVESNDQQELNAAGSEERPQRQPPPEYDFTYIFRSLIRKAHCKFENHRAARFIILVTFLNRKFQIKFLFFIFLKKNLSKLFLKADFEFEFEFFSNAQKQ